VLEIRELGSSVTPEELAEDEDLLDSQLLDHAVVEEMEEEVAM